MLCLRRSPKANGRRSPGRLRATEGSVLAHHRQRTGATRASKAKGLTGIPPGGAHQGAHVVSMTRFLRLRLGGGLGLATHATRLLAYVLVAGFIHALFFEQESSFKHDPWLILVAVLMT